MRVWQFRMVLWWTKRRADDRGASLVEYALLVALIAIVCVAAVSILGTETSKSFADVGDSVDAL